MSVRRLIGFGSILVIAAFSGACAKSGGNAASVPGSTQLISFESFKQAEKSQKPDSTPPANCAKTCQDRRQEFRYVVYAGHQIYCYWDLKGADTHTDFAQLATSVESLITDATTQSDYYLILRQWASAFHDGHVNVMTKSDLSGLEVYTAPIRVEVLAPATDHEKLIVAAVMSGNGMAIGLSVGDQITAINGVPAGDALTAAAAAASSGSTERMRRYWAGRRLVDVIGSENGSQPFVLSIRPVNGGAEKTVVLFRNVEIDPKPGFAPGSADSGIEYISAQILPDSIGYLRLDAFEGEQDEYLISEAMDRLSGTRGLVIDLRKNGGGDLSGDRIIERLANQVVTRYKRSEHLSDYLTALEPSLFNLTPDSTGQFALWHDLTVSPDSAHHYGNPVVALISPYCFSACDTFSAALRGNNLATFVGEPTGGGTGTPMVFDLPISPLSFRYSTIRGETPSGDLIEGNGTSPDIYLEPTAEDRALGKDTQLQKAIEVVESRITGTPVAGASKPVDLSNVPQIWQQSLDRAPTLQDNDFLLHLSHIDER